jgi:hypothetical protein
MISSPKRMVTIFWSPFGFRVIRVLLKEAHFDATYFRDKILNDTEGTRPTGIEEDDRRNESCIVRMQDHTRQGASLLIAVKEK